MSSLRSSVVLAALACAAVLVGAPAARADMPPPEGYVEACTAAIQQGSGAHCEECGSYFGSMSQCPDHYAGTAFKKRCQTFGASVWTEVWCDGPETAALSAPASARAPAHPAPGPASPAARGCCATFGARSGSLALLFAAALAALVAARRGMLGVCGA